jgi:hypothetical protein
LLFSLSAECAPAEAAQPPPAAPASEAADYVRVGDDERASGHVRVAVRAYRAALALDPANAQARRALAELCPDVERTAAPIDPLLDGIARYRSGDLEGAKARLLPLRGRDGEAGAAASFFLGMVYLRQEDFGLATEAFDRAAVEPAYRDLAIELRRMARRDGPIRGVILIQTEYDSNVGILTDAPATAAVAGAGQEDVAVLTTGTLAMRPLAGVAVRNTLTWRKYARESKLDLVRERAEGGVSWRGPIHSLTARYAFELDVVGGSLLRTAHEGSADVRFRLASGLALGGEVTLHWREFHTDEFSGLNGLVAAAAGDLRWDGGGPLGIDVGVIGVHEGTVDPGSRALGLGGRTAVKITMDHGIRLLGRLQALRLGYDQRTDTRLDGSLDLELDMGDAFVLVIGADVLANLSTDATFAQHKLGARVGLEAFL